MKTSYLNTLKKFNRDVLAETKRLERIYHKSILSERKRGFEESDCEDGECNECDDFVEAEEDASIKFVPAKEAFESESDEDEELSKIPMKRRVKKENEYGTTWGQPQRHHLGHIPEKESLDGNDVLDALGFGEAEEKEPVEEDVNVFVDDDTEVNLDAGEDTEVNLTVGDSDDDEEDFNEEDSDDEDDEEDEVDLDFEEDDEEDYDEDDEDFDVDDSDEDSDEEVDDEEDTEEIEDEESDDEEDDE